MLFLQGFEPLIQKPYTTVYFHSEGPEKATRGGEWELIKILLQELGIFFKINPKLLSSNSVKTG
jgi:hypothetical protein